MKYKIGTKEKPMVLKTPPLSSEYTMHTDIKDGKEVLVCTVGKTVFEYLWRCIYITFRRTVFADFVRCTHNAGRRSIKIYALGCAF